MRINGEWYVGDENIARPIIRGAIRDRNGAWQRTLFLVDTGADRTVFSAAILAVLGLSPAASHERLGGVGGQAEAVEVETQIRFFHDGPGQVVFRGQYAAFTSLEALDISVLGRDITDLFTIIIDRPHTLVCLLRERHRYMITP